MAAAFVKLADTLVADFELIDLMQTLVETSVELLDADAAGLMLRTPSGELQVMASTTEDAEFVELSQLGAKAGPCWDCARTGEPVTIGDVDADGDRWPAFRQVALQRGFHSAHATPLRLRGEVIGTMNLFSARTGALNDADIAAAQALSDVAAIGIIAGRVTHEQHRVAAQLQHALDSRVVIEQAKGILAQSGGISMADAFTSLRSFARSSSSSIQVVAFALVERHLAPALVITDSARRRVAASASAQPRRRRSDAD